MNTKERKIEAEKLGLDKVPTIKELRAHGVKVKITHLRAYLGGLFLSTPEANAVKSLIDIGQPSPRGGVTKVSLFYPKEGRVESVTEHAVCSAKDDYIKKFGVSLALKRALQTIHGEITQ